MTQKQSSSRYSIYVLVVLIIVYFFNFVDRQILSILAEKIKADLGVSDADIGFLYGTAFAVFYAIFGIPLGRLADVWTRKSLISLGLAFWSLMTALSGTAKGFFSLAIYRFGVGIGESSASPAAFSMLSDYFPPHLRATVLALYSTGIYIGAGVGIFLGGWIADSWDALYPDPRIAPFALRGWQVAFFAVGLPGLLMALWVRTLREPKRGMSEGVGTSEVASPFREFAEELMSVLPPLTVVSLWRHGAGSRGIGINLATAAIIAIIAWIATYLTGDTVQWSALGVGVYAACSWIQKLALTDPPAFALIIGSRALRLCVPAFACIAFVTYGLGFWGAPFFIRVHGDSATEVGIYVGLSAAIGGLVGVAAGGGLSDYLLRHTAVARIYVGLLSIFLSIPCVLVLLSTDDRVLAYVMNFFFNVFSPMWIGAASSTVNDLVMPRMRAVASAMYILVVTFIGLALGPYTIGRISDALEPHWGEQQALVWAMGYALFILVPAVIAFVASMRYLEQEGKDRLSRARAAGESIQVLDSGSS